MREMEIEPNSDGQEIVSHEIIENPKVMSPYDANGVYKTNREMQDAIDRGTFNIAKTMYVAKNGEFYFLTYGLGKTESIEASVRDVRLQDSQQDELDQTSKLRQMLDAQSCLN